MKSNSKSSVCIASLRRRSGLTQEQLAEKMSVSVTSVQNWEKGSSDISFDRLPKLADVLNVSVDDLVCEITAELKNRQSKDNWPDFLFSDVINKKIDRMSLNLLQQELFGVLCIYDAKFLDDDKLKDSIDASFYREQCEAEFSIYNEDLKNVPFEFVNKVGSINFMKNADRLFEVIRYLKKDFLLKILKNDPDTEFSIRKLSKRQIIELIDYGFRETFWDEYLDYSPFEISMSKAEILLPFLEKNDSIHLTDQLMKDNKLPEDVKNVVLKLLNLSENELQQHYSQGLNPGVSNFDYLVLMEVFMSEWDFLWDECLSEKELIEATIEGATRADWAYIEEQERRLEKAARRRMNRDCKLRRTNMKKIIKAEQKQENNSQLPQN